MNSSQFATDVKKGLLLERKWISSKYLYDEKGSDLFVQITQLEEYYPSQCEKEIFVEQSPDIVKALHPKTNAVIELGCGDGFKTEVLLKSMAKEFSPLSYVPIDISPTSIDIIENRIQKSIPTIDVHGFKGDYFRYFEENTSTHQETNNLILFLGSNIGNFSFEEAVKFLSKVCHFMDPNDALLIGMDLKKDIHIMNNAYNDPKGVTAAFNFNLLHRMNHELGADFDPNQFHHHGVYNVEMGAMQSFLVSKIEQVANIKSLGIQIEFDKLEPIHIENSCKYSIKNIHTLAKACGFHVKHNFIDKKGYFVDSLWKKEAPSTTL